MLAVLFKRSDKHWVQEELKGWLVFKDNLK